MANGFRMTPDKSLDRQYLRLCAVYRATLRYGMSRPAAIAAMVAKGIKERDAIAVYEIWPHT